MASVREECELGASSDEVWKLISDFGGFVEALGAPKPEIDGQGVGMTRTIAFGPEPAVERLEEIDDAAKRVVYSMVSGPIPVADYRSTMQLTDLDGGRTKLEWFSTFEPAGIPEEQAVAIVTAVYQGGIGALQSRFGS